jgi:hypothetical protein
MVVAGRSRRFAPLLALAVLAMQPVQAQSPSFVAAGAQVVGTGASITPTIPAGTAAGDFAVLIIVGRPDDTSVPSAPSGWTLRTSVLRNVSSNDLHLITFYRLLTGGDANPVLALPAGWQGGSAGMSGQIAVWRGVDTVAPFDVADTTGDSNPSDTWDPPGITTITAGARVVSAVATSDENDVGFSSAASFTARMSGTSYDTSTGGDHSVALADKLQATAGSVSMPQWEQNENEPDRWAGITFALRPIVPITLEFRLEEANWTGAAGEVKENGGSGANGTAFGGATTANTSPALPSNPGTCGYGVFDGNNDYVEIANHPAANIANALTVTAWIYARSVNSGLRSIVSKDTNYEFHIDSTRHVYWWWNDSAGNTRSITTTNQITLNRWHHIAVAYQSGTQRIYIDGVVQGTTGSYTGTLAQNALPLYIGTDWNQPTRMFDGYIDEVRIVPRYLTQAEVQAIRNETHPCATAAAQFTINHDRFGINCVAESITVNVVDSAAGTPLLNYNAPVQLDTQTGYGTWALVTGSGAFSDGAANDGIATYTWPLGQSQAVFTLYYPQGPPSMDVDVFQISNTGIRDTDAEGNLVFSANGFSVTAAALPNPPGAVTSFATNQTAGTNFALHIAAYGQTPSDPVCGIIEAYTGTKSLKFWSQYANPNTGTRSVTINTVSAAVSEAASAVQNVIFTNGQAVVTAKYKDVGQIRVLMKDDTTVDPVQAAFVFGDLLALPVDLSYAVYFAAIGTVIVLDAKRTGLDMRHRSSHRRHASRARAPHLD